MNSDVCPYFYGSSYCWILHRDSTRTLVEGVLIHLLSCARLSSIKNYIIFIRYHSSTTEYRNIHSLPISFLAPSLILQCLSAFWCLLSNVYNFIIFKSSLKEHHYTEFLHIPGIFLLQILFHTCVFVYQLTKG